MPKKTTDLLSGQTRLALRVLGNAIQAARKEHNMSQLELATRLGVSRYSVLAIEKGDAKVAIGTVFEAATIVGIPLLSETRQDLEHLNNTVAHLLTVLPQRSGRTEKPLDDDF